MLATPAAPSSTQKPGVVMSAAYADGQRVKDVAIEEAGDWARRPGHLVWIGLYEPSAELLGEIQAQFDLHPLAIEDAQDAHQRPKLERYGDCLFVVARTAQLVQGRIALGETHLFIGRGFVVTVRHGASVSYTPVREKTEACPDLLAHGEDYILYAVLDFIVDNYAPVMETVLAEVEAIEDSILKRELRSDEVERLYMLRRDLLRLRTAVVPLVEVCRKLEHGDLVAIDEEMQPLFRDVSDHLRRAQDEIDAVREVLAFAFEASLMLGQAQQTVITRRLAAWAAILAVPTAIAGIYGMNFEIMPELKWRYGYYLVLGGILAACALLYWRFRRNGWL
ncbi:magnesium and cobalt transport protein CorA [Methylobacterium gregans]|uniref:Cobalt/magnesium transport protein CorA n=1 Tax=Methylobacterium gregans TaxID=374424 RepID=A0AA37HSK4_9HYPH|nr:magnesium and cobalt transport protein CorA [Methylobacterium gregans]MDQ0521316.1 magnesium transporter [Methylobacterium gregans]GJD80871.1 Cobalt/magnesium transport protein CorA [Methylobacterium gregans]GLS54479.1 magnesium transporter [Methylobacterium gregans]